MAGKIFSLGLLSIGLFILMQIVLPLLSYKLWEIKNIAPETLLVSPQTNQSVLGISIQNSDNFPSFISNLKRETVAPYSTFTISIPKLNIKSANVLVDTNNLSEYLSHLPGSALPGERGNVFISGHSALPVVFEGEKNYGAIFANLTELKKGDTIVVSAGGQFTYQVVGMRVVEPNDLSVIPPPDSEGRYLSLMTCVPPGLNTKRLVVLGRLI